MLKLSVLDLVPVPSGSNPEQALSNTVELARLAEELGYTRYWIAEHHGSPRLASTAPEILIARIAHETSRMTIGSGATLLPYYSALKVSEVFLTLSALYPGRIDLGIGRGVGSHDMEFLALTGRQQKPSHDEFEDQILEVLAFLSGAFPSDHPFHSIHVSPQSEDIPNVWLLGSSLQTARLAASYGLPLGYALFLNHESPSEALQAYRSGFASERWLAQPQALAAVEVVCAPTSAEALSLAYEQDDTPRQASKPGDPSILIGDPQSVTEQIRNLQDRLQLKEIMISTLINDHDARLRSYRLLAEALKGLG